MSLVILIRYIILRNNFSDNLINYDIDNIGYMKLNGRDGFESYIIPKDGVLGLGNKSYSRPLIFDENMPILKAYIYAIQEATMSIHRALSRELGLQAGDKFE
ncbi:hypothetical protein LOCC1_G002462 [Lachnellula occidentalis]|uniref:Uncharacterized protein n=1 Tax=Lachnellula occidentalis TaxID=215460 RepID=A0A8H8UHB1_9HELO|nr:hypothetical protein LOCC1_G002462 [Lachnellula occidentalis]